MSGRGTRRKSVRQVKRQAFARSLSRGGGFETLEHRVLLAADTYRSIDGTDNNLLNSEWGSAGTQLIRYGAAEYADGISTMGGVGRPTPREVSNAVAAQSGAIVNNRDLTDFVWLWGQFIDHDLDLTGQVVPNEVANIPVPTGDPFFDPFSTGTQTISFTRSLYDASTGTSTANPRQQINQITSFIDGSQVYGSSATVAAELREFVGGRMATSAGDLLPFDPNSSNNEFLAGDVRANENVLLTSMHTLWVREHNRLAGEIAASDYAGADLSDPAVDEAIYQRARQLVGALIESITFREFLPAIKGYGIVDPYVGYNPNLNPSIATEFSTAAYRVGHTMLSPTLQRVGPDGGEIAAGDLELKNAFFNPQEVLNEGIDSLLRGASTQRMQEIDSHIVDAVRNFLFGPPGAGGLDLASLNIQRGRDHGLPSYNELRAQFGLGAVTSFDQISSDPQVVAALQSVYASVDDIDLWVGGISEDHVLGSSLGPLFLEIFAEQFDRVRDGDRYWYQNVLNADEIAWVENTTLSDVIERNTGISGLQDNVFLASSVLYYQAPTGTTISQLRVVSQGGQYQIFADNSLVASQAAAATTQVIVVGPRDNGSAGLEIQLDANALPSQLTIDGGTRGTTTLTILGREIRDTMRFGNDIVTINGKDSLIRRVQDITVFGYGGNDDLRATGPLATPLALYGGYGNDILVGGDAGDLLLGEYGNDTIYGYGGDDHIEGGAGNDILRGGVGADVINGQAGDDTIYGDDGDDLLYGAAGADTIYGGAGRDKLYGHGDNDTLDGGLDNDIVIGGPGDDLLHGGSGNDTVYGDDGYDRVFGDDGDDFLRGGNQDDLLYGGAGRDIVQGDAGKDYLQGNDGDDLLLGGAEDDVVLGGAGDDMICGDGGNDTLKGDAGHDVIMGGVGNDMLFGLADDDELRGGTGDDKLYGGDGNDYLLGDGGADMLFGEGGDDVATGGDQNDLIRGGAGSDVLHGGAGDDTIYGDNDADLLLGDEGNDTLDGGAGDDYLVGGDGHDTLFGRAGNDVLVGNAGDDYLRGSLGRDALFGGVGRDTFFGDEDDDLLVRDMFDPHADSGGPGLDCDILEDTLTYGPMSERNLDQATLDAVDATFLWYNHWFVVNSPDIFADLPDLLKLVPLIP